MVASARINQRHTFERYDIYYIIGGGDGDGNGDGGKKINTDPILPILDMNESVCVRVSFFFSLQILDIVTNFFPLKLENEVTICINICVCCVRAAFRYHPGRFLPSHNINSMLSDNFVCKIVRAHD